MTGRDLSLVPFRPRFSSALRNPTSWAARIGHADASNTSPRMSSNRISGSEKPVEVVGVALDLEGAANTQVWQALGDEFMQGDQGETVELSSLRGEGKVIGLYFSPHW